MKIFLMDQKNILRVLSFLVPFLFLSDQMINVGEPTSYNTKTVYAEEQIMEEEPSIEVSEEEVVEEELEENGEIEVVESVEVIEDEEVFDNTDDDVPQEEITEISEEIEIDDDVDAEVLDSDEEVLEIDETSTESNITSLEQSTEETSSETSTVEVIETIEETVDDETLITTVITGDSVATAGIVNFVNTNLTNSEGIVLLLNNLFGSIDSVDLRNLPFFQNNIADDNLFEDESCDDIFCLGASGEAYINNNNSATVSNSLVVRAQTGNNNIETDGDGLIETGDAYAVADVVNVVNTNITDSKYALLVINNFGDWFGDFVFPSIQQFEDFFANDGFSGNTTNINTANISNDVEVHTDTGNNTVSGDNSTIDTGRTQSVLNLINNVNNNLTGGESLAIVFRVHGDWLGDKYNLPEGLVWDETDNSISLYLDPSIYGSSSGGNENLNVENVNDALIDNNVSVYALTGENNIDAGGDAEIKTGNAYAAANVINIANTNVLSRNWIYAIVNIFGDWHGDVSFGRPDLWVGGMVDQESRLASPGTQLTYHYTITNNGDAPASEIVLESVLDSNYLTFDENQSSEMQIAVEDLAPNESVELYFTATVSEDAPHETTIDNNLEVVSQETDNNDYDNSDLVSITVNQVERGGRRGYQPVKKEVVDKVPNFIINKTHDADEVIEAPTSVTYKIEVYNDSPNPAYNAVLADILTDENEEIIHQENWELGKILPYEEITVDYTVEFNKNIVPGIYTNYAKVFSTSSEGKKAKTYNSMVVSTKVEVVVGEVLGIETCSQYIDGYVIVGKENPTSRVIRLKQFLNENEGGVIEVNGEYDLGTIDAVKNFQQKYASEILEPWGLSQATGNVYYTTAKKINEVACASGQTFPLNENQLNEIALYKNRSNTINNSPIVYYDVPRPEKVIEKNMTQQPTRKAVVLNVAHAQNNEIRASDLIPFKVIWKSISNNFSRLFSEFVVRN